MWSANTEWKLIAETGAISNSTYEFAIASTGLNWRLIRLDKLTGEAWKNSEGKWVKFTTVK